MPYISELGISTLYASPVFRARKGSLHGYDVIDSNMIHPETGTPESLEKLSETLAGKGMDLLQDIVPNHMAFSSQNGIVMDIFENGMKSPFIKF